jgi:hypothetical protein
LILVFVQFASEGYKLTWIYKGNYFGFLNMRYMYNCTDEEIIELSYKEFVDIPDKVMVLTYNEMNEIVHREYKEVRPRTIISRLIYEESRVVKVVWRRRWWQGGSFNWKDFWPWSYD